MGENSKSENLEYIFIYIFIYIIYNIYIIYIYIKLNFISYLQMNLKRRLYLFLQTRDQGKMNASSFGKFK